MRHCPRTKKNWEMFGTLVGPVIFENLPERKIFSTQLNFMSMIRFCCSRNFHCDFIIKIWYLKIWSITLLPDHRKPCACLGDNWEMWYVMSEWVLYGPSGGDLVEVRGRRFSDVRGRRVTWRRCSMKNEMLRPPKKKVEWFLCRKKMLI